MPEIDLDEVDLSLLDLIAYVRRCGVHPSQVERLLYERLTEAFDIADQYCDLLDEIPITH